jgi:hypothetical protein
MCIAPLRFAALIVLMACAAAPALAAGSAAAGAACIGFGCG